RLRRRACSRARTAARACASRDLRELEAAAEYAGFFFAVEVRWAALDFRVAASALAAGRQTATPSRAVRKRTTSRGRIKRTNPPNNRPNGRLGATGLVLCGTFRSVATSSIACNHLRNSAFGGSHHT